MSNNRYNNAGSVGTGTTVSNMDSRIKMWVALNHSGTPAVYDSYNVSSLTDNGTGQTGVFYTNLFAVEDAYALFANNHGGAAPHARCTTPRRVTDCNLTSYDSANAVTDSANSHAGGFGDLV
jgi:hypothetical protein